MTSIQALQKIITILEEHPTNGPNGQRPLFYGEEGYDARARYAYLEAKDAVVSYKPEDDYNQKALHFILNDSELREKLLSKMREANLI